MGPKFSWSLRFCLVVLPCYSVLKLYKLLNFCFVLQYILYVVQNTLTVSHGAVEGCAVLKIFNRF